MSLKAGDRLGAYEVRSLLGVGGMGEVYRAHDTKLGRDVAIKVLPPGLTADAERLTRFEREARLLASLNHPNIAAIYGVEESSGHVALVLELVEGETLAERIAKCVERVLSDPPGLPGPKGPGLQITDAIAIARQIAEALDAAHERGIVHRDLKPANIKITPDGVVKVLDFGLAKAGTGETGGAGKAGGEDLTHSPTVMGPTLGGVLLGTAPYMSPEQARGKSVDKRTDIWAFGCVLYEMLTGRRAFLGETTTDVLAKIVEREPDWSLIPAATPRPLARLIRRCLEKDSKTRLRDIGDAGTGLDDPSPTPPGPLPPVAPRIVTMRLAVAALAVALAAALSALVWLTARSGPVPAHAVQFTFAAPDQTQLEIGAPTPSPDGARVAFVARSSSGRRSLWLRDVGSTAVREVPDTDDATGPFWSADGRYLGFFGQGRVKKVSLSGGPALTICTIQNLLGATWNRDNVIVLAPVNRTVLYKVSAAGGTPEPITSLNEARKENSHRWPQFLPDGRHFLFTARSDAIQNNLIYVGSLDSKEVTPLIAAQSNASYAAGYLLFAREGTLMAQRFDTATLTLSGEAVAVAPRIFHNTPSSSAAFAVSTDGTVLGYEAGIEARSTLAWFDRTGKAVGTLGGERNFSDVRLSPDGKLAAVVVPDADSGNRDIWIADIRTGTMTRFTTNPANDWQTAWSPDSRRLAFASDRNGRSSVYVKSIEGGEEELLVRLPDRGVFPKDWSKDGSILALSIDSPAGTAGLGAMRLTGDRAPFAVGESTAERQNDVMLTPDTQWMAFVSRESGNQEVFVERFPKGGRRRVSAGGGSPRWNASGAELYYLSLDGAVMAVRFRGHDPIEPEAPVRLFRVCNGLPIAVGAYTYDVAPDGSRFLAICPSPSSSPSAITVAVDWIASLK